MLLVLARMRGQADDIVPELSPMVMELATEAWPALWRALGDLTPYCGPTVLDDPSVMPTMPPARYMWAFLRQASPEVAASAVNEIGRFAYRVDFRERIDASSELSELRKVLEEDGSPDRRILAAELIGNRGGSARHLLPALREAVLGTHPTTSARVDPATIAGLEYDGAGMPKLTEVWVHNGVSIDQEVHSAAAAAMEKIAPGDPIVAVAVAHRLVHHPDVGQRVDAAMVLGGFGTRGEGVVPQLLQALGDGEERVVAEAITALGMIGPAARDAIAMLEKLSQHENPQIAERAKAALGHIKRGP